MTAPDMKPRHTASPVFSRLPPAVFPPILGLLGLALALRMAAGIPGLAAVQALADLAAGIAVAVWAFAVIGLKIKNFRRFSVILDDLSPLPGRVMPRPAWRAWLRAAFWPPSHPALRWY